MIVNSLASIESRYDEIKQLISDGFTNDSTIMNIDGLLDAFLVLYDECSRNEFKREKTVKRYLENGNY